jgi:glyoxylase-like metal-dependent hydrolase (beta-lactamase superfamily II)
MKVLTSVYKKFDKNWSSSFPPYLAGSHDLLLDFSRGSVPFLDYTIIATPGHTPDSISLLDSEGCLFAGDAAANFLQFAGTHYAPPFITDLNRFYATWKELLALPLKRIYPAHGKSFSPDKLKKHMHSLKECKMEDFS